jgi:hypothetical protein
MHQSLLAQIDRDERAIEEIRKAMELHVVAMNNRKERIKEARLKIRKLRMKK